MSKIQLLPEQLINQIAAGEVVERPASVVKELLENSLDAGAKKITIEIRQGGIAKIKITDDGSGMSDQDALMALERHATSKIRTLEDLQAVRSMGFRGEAMASIASVSKLTLRTKQKEDLSGTEIYAEGGKILRQSPIGLATGTEIEVDEIFYNTPARLKFLKTEQTEYQNVMDTVINASLAFPQTAFKLINEWIDEQSGELHSKVTLDLPGTENLAVRVRGILGKAITDEMIEIFSGGVNLKINGFIGKPSLSRANRSMQYFFVNGRPINSHVLSYAVKQAYHSLLPKERYPVFVVMFELEPSMVDVNCHPRKTEVKFKDEREVYRVLSMACSKALEKAVLAPKIGQASFNYYQEKSPTGIVDFQALGSKETVSVTVNTVENPQVQIENSGAYCSAATSMCLEKDQTEASESKFEMEAELIPIGQLNNSFIVCQKGTDLVIIDQHAAHERIRYNKLISESEKEEKAVQPLLMPLNVELSPADIAVLNANKTLLDEVGLKLDHFGGNTFAISEVPGYLAKLNLEKTLLGLIDDLRDNFGNLSSHKGELFSRKEKVLTYLACRSAVKFGDTLSREEMSALIEQLNSTPFGKTTCPHGRPVMVVMEAGELWSRFGRKYRGFFEKENFPDVNC